MNAFFALSAIFSLGLRGIDKRIEPGPPVSHFSPEDRLTGKVKMLSTSLESATKEMMKPDSIAREEAVFGNDFVEHFGGTRQHEVKVWNEAVTNWEGKRLECHLIHIMCLIQHVLFSREVSGACLSFLICVRQIRFDVWNLYTYSGSLCNCSTSSGGYM